MKRRLFNILAAVSLLLCLATSVLWIGSYRHGRFYFSHWDVTDGLLWVSWSVPPRPFTADPFAFLGFTHIQGDIDAAPGGGAVANSEEVAVPCWFLCTLTAILPAIWLWRRNRHRPATGDGMPHCAKCDYSLTGNVSGICPECGTPIPADLVRMPLT